MNKQMPFSNKPVKNKIEEVFILEGILKITLVSLFFRHLEQLFRGILSIIIKKHLNKFLSFILSFASRAYDGSNML